MTEGGITDTTNGTFIPYKGEVDKAMADGTYDVATWVKTVWNVGFLTLPGYGRVVHWTGHWVFEGDGKGNLNLIFQSGKYDFDYAAICAYLGHPAP